jgi:RNA polymerase sigma-70 factor (ECF subfamily)
MLCEMVLDANDRELIEACQGGDHDAFRLLFEANQDKVYSIALRFSGDPSAALDIAQDTFLKLLSQIQSFRGDSNFASWLYRIVVNSCLDYRRSWRRWSPLVQHVFNALAAPAESVLDTILRIEAGERVQKAVARLAPEQRMVVILRYTEGLSYEEIAAILGCSAGTVASRLNRAHKALERRLANLRGDVCG